MLHLLVREKYNSIDIKTLSTSIYWLIKYTYILRTVISNYFKGNICKVELFTYLRAYNIMQVYIHHKEYK